MNSTEPYIIQLDVPKPQASTSIILNKLTNDNDKELWRSHGKPPKRAFPDFGNLPAEVEAIKQTLRAKVDKTTRRVNLENSGTARKKGLLLVPSKGGAGVPAPGQVRASIS